MPFNSRRSIKKPDVYPGVDRLTQIANRGWFDEYLEKMWKQHQRDQTPMALILSDIDYFKAYNDTYGHPAGDYCLRTIAELLDRHVQRPNDLVARYGGEEFAAILPNTNLAGAHHIAETILKKSQPLAVTPPRITPEDTDLEHWGNQPGASCRGRVRRVNSGGRPGPVPG